jgi:hypothetical protein
LINDDVAGLILRVMGMGDYILHFVAAIIASALKKAGIFFCILCCSTHHVSQRPRLKNLRNPENPDSKPSYRIKPDYLLI